MKLKTLLITKQREISKPFKISNGNLIIKVNDIENPKINLI